LDFLGLPEEVSGLVLSCKMTLLTLSSLLACGVHLPFPPRLFSLIVHLPLLLTLLVMSDLSACYILETYKHSWKDTLRHEKSLLLITISLDFLSFVILVSSILQLKNVDC
jgi:hypothetical protein